MVNKQSESRVTCDSREEFWYLVEDIHNLKQKDDNNKELKTTRAEANNASFPSFYIEDQK